MSVDLEQSTSVLPLTICPWGEQPSLLVRETPTVHGVCPGVKDLDSTTTLFSANEGPAISKAIARTVKLIYLDPGMAPIRDGNRTNYHPE